MPKLEERLPCPVCLGVKMQKLTFPRGDLVIDYCQRCDGIWFDRGEVQRIGTYKPQALWRKITPKAEAFHMQCHDCYGMMERNAEKCPDCEWKNVIDCPKCSKPMKPVQYQNLKLDVCKHCRGVWFDAIELSEIWNLKFDELAQKRRSLGGKEIADEGAAIFLDALIWAPDLVFEGADAVIHAGGSILESAADLPIGDLAESAVEATGELAGNVFEAIAEIIGDILSDFF